MLAWIHADKGRSGDMPDLPDYGAHLLDWLSEIGLANWDKPHDYTNLSAWAAHIGLSLTPWEITTMRQLSVVYLSSMREYSDNKNAAPPHINVEQQRASVASKLRSMRGAAKRG